MIYKSITREVRTFLKEGSDTSKNFRCMDFAEFRVILRPTESPKRFCGSTSIEIIERKRVFFQ